MNETALPDVQRDKSVRPVSIGSLAILERLGNPLVATIIGVGDAKFTDNLEHLLELFYVHSVSESDYQDIVRNINDPDEIRRQAIVWGSGIGIQETAERLQEILYQSELVQGSMV